MITNKEEHLKMKVLSASTEEERFIAFSLYVDYKDSEIKELKNLLYEASQLRQEIDNNYLTSINRVIEIENKVRQEIKEKV